MSAIHVNNVDTPVEPSTSDNDEAEYAACIKEALALRDRSWLAEKLRDKIGATQQDLAAAFRVSQATISRDLAWRRHIRSEAERLGLTS